MQILMIWEDKEIFGENIHTLQPLSWLSRKAVAVTNLED